MENERSNVWVWILWIVIIGNYAIWLKHFVYWEKSNLGVTENSLMSLGGQKENVSNKVNSPPIRDFMNEMYQDIQFKPFKIWLSNLPFRRSLASSKLNPFLFPQELKFNLETTSKTIQ